MEVIKANGDVGVVAIDDFSHSADEVCDTLPVEAQPVQTTVPPKPTTLPPTEPPGRTLYTFLIEFQYIFLIFSSGDSLQLSR